VEASGGVFQIRSHRDFVPSKGRDRLLSLRLLSELPFEDMNNASSDLSSNSEPRNAYEFMRRRQETGADPTLKRWNASIRLSNFASVESSPLCVSLSHRPLKNIVDVLAICSDVLNWSAT
jgi:DNA mismatch repair protein MSH5